MRVKRLLCTVAISTLLGLNLTGCGWEKEETEGENINVSAEETADSKQASSEADDGDGIAVEEDTEKQINTNNFTKKIEAYKEFYDTFYEEHRFNGNYEQVWDCFANVYMLEGEPIMAVLDVLTMEESSSNEYDDGMDAKEFIIADIYLFEYKKDAVQEKAKYTSIQISDAEVYLVPMQDKLFMSYFDKKGQFVTAELEEYCTLLDEEYYAVYHNNMSEDVASEEKYIEEVCHDWISYESLEDVYTTYDIASDEQEKVFLKTGLGETKNDGSYLLHRGYGKELDYAMQNYQLVSDAIDFKQEEDFFYGTSFKKYLDFLMEQEITNDIDLRVCHSKYLIDNTKEAAEHLSVFIWMDGVYYVVEDKTAYVYAFDYGYSKDNLPKELYGYEISEVYWSEKTEGESYFPVSLEYKIALEDVWKEVEIAQEEYEELSEEHEESLEVAIEAYRQYLDTDDINKQGIVYLICVNDDDIPEVLIDTVYVAGGQLFLSYADGTVNSEWLPYGSCSYVEKQNLFSLSHGRMGYYGNVIYKIADGKLAIVEEGSYSEGTGDDAWYWNGVKVSPEEYENRLYASFPREQASYMTGYPSFEEAYAAFSGKVTAQYYMSEYLISTFNISDGKLTVVSESAFDGSGKNTISFEVASDCDWYESDVTGERYADTTYEILKEEIRMSHEYYAQDRANAIIESPKGIVISVEEGVVVEVYGVIS